MKKLTIKQRNALLAEMREKIVVFGEIEGVVNIADIESILNTNTEEEEKYPDCKKCGYSWHECVCDISMDKK